MKYSLFYNRFDTIAIFVRTCRSNWNICLCVSTSFLCLQHTHFPRNIWTRHLWCLSLRFHFHCDFCPKHLSIWENMIINVYQSRAIRCMFWNIQLKLLKKFSENTAVCGRAETQCCWTTIRTVCVWMVRYSWWGSDSRPPLHIWSTLNACSRWVKRLFIP